MRGIHDQTNAALVESPVCILISCFRVDQADICEAGSICHGWYLLEITGQFRRRFRSEFMSRCEGRINTGNLGLSSRRHLEDFLHML